ncbi:RNA helicase [Candidatus Epulonipiscium fishelsonii]|uniref:RNA helicase n=1 Tax=Candidatus Epulonipiscium fishelsonii TaxID=77094 RepID=A0ACC8XA81_9FIRM|nr:RNA helicase [Epulopiscium sp. SCG-B11WGA-EpuloA1]
MEIKLFEQLELSTDLKKAIIDMGFEKTTPIQGMAIPHVLEGKDIIAQAPTGTGKTCAFGIPAIEKIDIASQMPQVLVLCPTRELALQISRELKKLCKYKRNINILPIYGGESIERQITALKRKPQIIVGTPGRVMDHIRRKTLKLQEIKTLVLDEADEMLNMGFREDIDIILETIPQDKQFILFSATLPKAILDIANKYQKESAVRISATPKTITVPTIEQFYLDVYEDKKTEVLSRLIDANHFKLMLIFCNTKRKVDDLYKELLLRGYRIDALHGDMKQMQRDSVMNKFRKGLVDILIATDVAARGIDVDDVEAVFNYDIPSEQEYYVHRIGRTGRANRKGVAYSLISGKEIYKLREIERYTKTKIQKISPPSMEDIKENKIKSIIDEIKVEISKENTSKYLGYVDNLINEISADKNITSYEITAAFLSKSINNLTIGSSSKVRSDELEVNRDKGMINDKRYARLFINLGSKDKLQTAQLLKLIINNTSVKQKEMGKLDMLEKFSFFEVPKYHVEDVIESLKTKKFKGRKINIEVANKKNR